MWARKRVTQIMSGVIIGALIGLVGSGESMAQDQGEFSARGFNTARIENEYKLEVPREKTEAVWKYLNERYENGSPFLKGLGSGFTTQFSEEYFVDRYFDNDRLDLLRSESGIRHRSRKVMSDPTHKKDGRQLVQIKLNRPGDLETNRTELKFPVNPEPIAKNAYDHHPLLGLIDRDYRASFLENLQLLGLRPESLWNTITLEQRRRRVYLSKDGQAFATITLDEITSHKWWKTIRFTEIEMELNEIGYTEGSETEKVEMQRVNDLIKNDLFTPFPEIHQDQTPKYNKAFEHFSKEFLFFRWALRYDLPVEGLIAGIGLLALLGTLWMLFRGKKPAKPNVW